MSPIILLCPNPDARSRGDTPSPCALAPSECSSDDSVGNLAGNANSGSFNNRGTNGNFWSSSESGTDAWNRNLNSGNATVNRNTNAKSNAFSVRCLKDSWKRRPLPGASF
jgi:hypothetical protein